MVNVDSRTVELMAFTVTVLPLVPTRMVAIVVVEPPGGKLIICVVVTPSITTVLVKVAVAAPRLV